VLALIFCLLADFFIKILYTCFIVCVLRVRFTIIIIVAWPCLFMLTID